MTHELMVPVIAVDGGAGTGKGTVSSLLVKELGFNYLDSGALYRGVAMVALHQNIIEPEEVAQLARRLVIKMEEGKIIIFGNDWTEAVRSEEGGKQASIISAMPLVRQALLASQLNYRCLPGLVADGRDMGMIFDTPYRFFLTASPEVQAQRRYLQLKERGQAANYSEVLKEIKARDERDKTRAVAPLQSHPAARTIKTDAVTAEQVAEEILYCYRHGM